ncbi:MAG: hypothetical protein LC780_07005 [Acidobacteria bacterium]|nr:hypothetical protein [Acidobacteriota bacterium]
MKTVFDAVGDVRDVDLLAAFVDRWRRKSAGLISFSRAGASAAFGIADGDVVSVSSSEPRFESSAILVRAGKLDAAALERLSAPEGQDGALAALQAGILTKREWRWGEKIRGIEVLADLLSWPDGKYYLDSDARPAPGEFTVAIPRLLLELFLRSRDRNLIEHQLGRSDATLVRSGDFDTEFATFGLTADAESVVRMIDGEATADEIARGAPADEFAVRKLLAALVTLGLLRTEPREPAVEGEDPLAATVTVPRAPEELEMPPEREEALREAGKSDAATAARPLPEPDVFDAAPESPAVELPEEIPSPESGFLPAAVLPQTSEFDLDPTPPSSLESFPLPGARDSSAPSSDPPRQDRGPVFDPIPPEEMGTSEPPRAGGIGPFVWVIVGLAALVGAIVFVRTRGGPSATPGGAKPAAAATAPAAAALESATSPVAAVPPAATPAAARPARRTAQPAQPSAPPARTAAPKPPAAVAAPSSPAASSSAGRSEWLARAARDRARLKSSRARYAIQLELACEVPSLSDAWKHDRPTGSMWLLTSQHGSRDCFRVLWGRYRTLDAARRGKSGIPSFFSTPANHPAVVSVP